MKNVTLNLASVLSAHVVDTPAPKVATSLRLKEDHPNTDPKLQAIVGDPLKALSFLVQTSPDTGHRQLANPLSPIEGDEIFYAGLIPGARFQSHDGQWWDIIEYDWEGKIVIQNPWYPRLSPVISIQTLRASIHSWIEPFTQIVPPPPAGVDYGVIEVKSVN